MKKPFLIFLFSCVASIGLHAQDYTFTQTTTTYQDLSGSTLLSNSEPWDDNLYDVPLTFPFIFHGHAYTSLTLDTYGYLNFDGDTIIFAGILADLMDRGDLVSQSPISYSVEGLVGNRIIKIEFKNAGFYDGPATNFINFQFWLYESDYAVELHVGPNTVQNPMITYGTTGPSTGVLEMSPIINAPLYSLFLTGLAASPSTIEWDGVSDLPALTGTPTDGTVYRFAQSTGACGWLAVIYPSNLFLCENTSGVLTVLPDSSTYQWYKNGIAILGATNQTLNVNSLNDAGAQFTVQVTQNSCVDTTLVTNVLLHTVPVPTLLHFSNGWDDLNGAANVCSGDTVYITLNETYDSIQWYKNNVPISTPNGGFIAVGESGDYSVEIISTLCPGVSNTSEPLTVIVHDLVVPIITQSNDTLYSIPGATYQWYLNGVSISGATNQWYVPTSAGDYTVEMATTVECPAAMSEITTITGLKNILETGITIYPNPAKDQLQIAGNNLTDARYTLYDATGRIMMDGELRNSINVSGVANGLYMLTITTGNASYKHTFVKE